MALTIDQKDFIILMDNKAKEILRHGGEDALLMSLCDKMNSIKGIMDASTQEELNYYCSIYEGFFQYMKLLERLAEGSSQGLFDDIMK